MNLLNEISKSLDQNDTDLIIESLLSQLCDKVASSIIETNDIEINSENKSIEDECVESNVIEILKVKCDSCGSDESFYWRQVARNKIVCNKCFFSKVYLLVFSNESSKQQQKSSGIAVSSYIDEYENFESIAYEKKTRSKSAVAAVNEIDEELDDDSVRTRKSTRSTKNPKRQSNNKHQKLQEQKETTVALLNPSQTGGKSRRTKVFKTDSTPPLKTETLCSTIFTSEFVFHRGFYMQVGDIVALFDRTDKETTYFAQIRAFLTDQYGQKSGVLTWLVPNESLLRARTTPVRIKDFDPSFFVLGPVEDRPRPLECMEFVCRLVDAYSAHGSKTTLNANNQFKNDLLQHKFALNDLAASKLKILTKRTYGEDNIYFDEEHELKWN